MVMREILESFAGKRILITGHTGFKGSWLAFILAQYGAEVIGYALPPTVVDSHFDMLEVRHAIQHVEGDIRNLSYLISIFKTFEPEFVFHLAAQALVRHSYSNPVETFSTNVMGSINLLEAVRSSASVRSLVYITSDKCYENSEWIWGYRENDRLGGHDPYSASKAAAEIAFSAYWRSFLINNKGLGAATARAGNVIGGGDWSADRIVPDCIRAFKSKQPVELRNSSATRPWQHVLEPLSGYLLLAAKLRDEPQLFSGSWNFGPSSAECQTVGEVASSIANYFGHGKVISAKAQKIQHEAQLLRLNCDKAHQLLDWYPRWDIDTTLRVTADWYRRVTAGESAKVVTAQQVSQYFNCIT
jgi:CDP-glucose 4,6-dehydratase